MTFFRIYSTLIFICLGIFGLAQNSIGDCIGAIPVCQSIYVEDVSHVGTGFIDPEIDNQISCLFEERNSAWYIFSIFESGDLGFSITPGDLNDDYDWCLFNITDKTCDDIHTGINFISSCNATGGVSSGISCHGETGADGSTPYSYQNPGCGIDPPDNLGFSPFNALIPVNKGETYVLLVENWTGSEFGYTLRFDIGDAIILDTTEIKVVETLTKGDLTCSWDGVVITFTEKIDCNSIDLSGVKIFDESNNELNINMEYNCSSDLINNNQLELIFNNPIRTDGIYRLIVNDAASDQCGNYNSSYELILELDVIEPNVFIPNTFTPNDDGLNDRLLIFPNEKITSIDIFQIYDRWGNLVVSEEDLDSSSFSWDGKFRNKEINSGIFVYQIAYETIYGEIIYDYGSISILK